MMQLFHQVNVKKLLKKHTKLPADIQSQKEESNNFSEWHINFHWSAHNWSVIVQHWAKNVIWTDGRLTSGGSQGQIVFHYSHGAEYKSDRCRDLMFDPAALEEGSMSGGEDFNTWEKKSHIDFSFLINSCFWNDLHFIISSWS